MKNILNLLAIAVLFVLAGCSYDNYDAPKSLLSGRAVYEGEAVSVRTNALRFSLYQDGYDFMSEIPAYIAQDGSFSASLFDGEYKLVRMAGAPWEAPQSDTIRITVKGNTHVDIPVTPFFTINNASFRRNENKIAATFTINQRVEYASLRSVSVYLGKGVLTDNNVREAHISLDLNNVVVGEPKTVEIEIPSSLQNASSVYARVGVQSNQANEFCYTQVERIALK